MLLFDLDGTLIDSNGVWEDVDTAFLTRRGLPVTDEYLHTVEHSIFPVAAAFTKEHFGLAESPEDIMDEWLSLARDAYAHTIPLKAGVRAFLDSRRGLGEDMAIVTACVPELARAVLARHGLTERFPHLVFAQEMGLEKRDPRFFPAVLNILGTTAADCTFFEDAPANCAAAKEAGLSVVGVYDHFYRHYEEEIRNTCDRYIYSFAELL